MKLICSLRPAIALTLTFLFSVPVSGPIPAAGSRGQHEKPAVDPAFAVKRTTLLVDAYRRDQSRAHLDEATDLLERARTSSYGRQEVLSWLGYLCILRGDYAEAAARLEEAVQKRPQTPAPYVDLAFALDRTGKYADAARYLETAAGLVPRDDTRKRIVLGTHDVLLRHIYLNLGGALARAGQQEAAVKAYSQAKSLTESISARASDYRPDRLDSRLRDYYDEDGPRIEDALSSALRALGRYTEAIAVAAKATDLRPANGEYWHGLGDAIQAAASHAAPGQPGTIRLWEQAAAAYSHAADLQPADSTVRELRGIALSEAGLHKAAIAEFERAAALRPANSGLTASGLFHYGVSESEAGDTAHAAELLERAAVESPERAQALQWLGLTDLRNRDPRAAIDPLTRAAKLDPRSVATHLDLGAAYIQTAQPELALGEYRRAVELQPESVEGQYALGRTLFELKQYEGAARAFRLAYNLLKSRPSGQPVVLYGKQGAQLGAAEIQHAWALSLELSGDLSGAADVHESAGAPGEMLQYAAAERYLLATREPTTANWDRAIAALDRAAKLQPNRHILESYADALRARNRNEEAATAYARAIESGLAEPHPTTPDPEIGVYTLREKYAETLRALGRDEEAATQLEAAAQKDRGSYNLLVVLGAIYQKRAASVSHDTVERDRWNVRAADAYIRALALPTPIAAPNSPATPPKLDVRRALATIELSLRRTDAARETASQILAEDPGDLNTAIIEYRILNDQHHDGEAARKVLLAALEHRDSTLTAGGRSSLLAAERAVAFQFLQRKPLTDADLHQAGVHYNRALELAPNDTESLNGKGVIALQRKGYGEAAALFKRAIAADPHNAAAYNNLGEAYEHLPGDHSGQALSSYRNALKANPNLKVAQFNVERFAGYAKLGWESRDRLSEDQVIPVYHSRASRVKIRRRAVH